MDENEKTIRNFFHLINEKDYEAIEKVLSDDLEWWIVGDIKTSGMKNKRMILLGFKLLKRIFKSFEFVLHDFTVQENRVAVTAESKATHKKEVGYNNHYHFLFFLEDGKIRLVKEYFDTKLAEYIESIS